MGDKVVRSSTGTLDGGVTIEDLLYYLQLFEAGGYTELNKQIKGSTARRAAR